MPQLSRPILSRSDERAAQAIAPISCAAHAMCHRSEFRSQRLESSRRRTLRLAARQFRPHSLSVRRTHACTHARTHACERCTIASCGEDKPLRALSHAHAQHCCAYASSGAPPISSGCRIARPCEAQRTNARLAQTGKVTTKAEQELAAVRQGPRHETEPWRTA
jgi:hypothetical protein